MPRTGHPIPDAMGNNELTTTEPAPTKILVVDDDEFDYRRSLRLLRRVPNHEYQVTWASTFEEALTLLQPESFDVVLLDFRLGLHTGTDLLIAARAQGFEGPALVLTGDLDPKTDRLALEAGASDFLIKNELDSATLDRAIRFAIKRDRGIRELRQSEQSARQNARLDPLTSLYNRAGFLAQLQEAILTQQVDPNRSFAVAFLDLDGFKAINDTLGHAAGDEVLRQTATRLRNNTRKFDVIARMGGDEFTLILPNVSRPEQVEAIASGLQNVLSRPFEIDADVVTLSASIGVGLSDHRNTDAEELLRRADTAMYASKAAGKACYTIYHPVLDQDSAAHPTNIAAHREDNVQRLQTSICFEPLVHQPSGSTIGHNLLLDRSILRHENVDSFAGGLSDFFYPAALGERDERSSRALVQSGIILASQWIQPHRIYYRPSAVHLFHERFVDELIKTLFDAALPRACFVVDIPGSSIASRAIQSIPLLDRLAEEGIGVCISEIITARLSLRQLSELSFEELRIGQIYSDLGPPSPEQRKSIEKQLRATVAIALAMDKTISAVHVDSPWIASMMSDAGIKVLAGTQVGVPASSPQHDPSIIRRHEQ